MSNTITAGRDYIIEIPRDNLKKPPEDTKKPSVDSSSWQRRCTTIKEVAINVFKLTTTIAVYWINPSLFALGFIAGVVIDGMQTRKLMKPIIDSIHIQPVVHRVKEVIEDMRKIWNTQTWGSMCLLGLGAFLALPVAMAATSFGVGAYVGSKMVRDGIKLSNGIAPKNPPFWQLCHIKG